MSMQSPNMKIVLKLALIAVLTVLLWIPALMILVLVEERADRQQEVRSEIENIWGGEQTIQGPVLVVPSRATFVQTDASGFVEKRPSHRFILPTTFEVKGRLEPEVRRRSIFEAVVYTAVLDLSGSYDLADLREVPVEALAWDQAELLVGLGDLRGLAEMPTVTWQGSPRVLEAAAREEFVNPALVASVPTVLDRESTDGVVRFEIRLEVRGSESLFVVPVGRTTRVELESVWPDPSFGGAFLPHERAVGDDGFDARWKVLHLNREFPQQWLAPREPDCHLTSTFHEAAFGVRLLPGIDAYARVSRALKYSGIFTLLTLMAFFVVEHGQQQQVHPLQYAVIGFGLCLFYLALLSIGEILPFDIAFLVAAATIVAFVTWYARGILRGRTGPVLVASVLGMVYLALFVMLRLEDLALLMGTVLLLLVLGVVMRLTRKLNQVAVPAEAPPRL